MITYGKNINSKNIKKSFNYINNELIKFNKHYGLTTHAMIFKRNNIQKIIDVINNSLTEIDNVYSDNLEERYCFFPMITYQSNRISDIGAYQYNIQNNYIMMERFDLKFNDFFNNKNFYWNIE